METSIKLSKWAKMFPDGISIKDYNRIQRLIRYFGGGITITVIKGNHYRLSSELSKLEAIKERNQ